MEKRNKKVDRPKLRKEDIGKPVNFVHVQHVGFGDKSAPQSASAIPTFENMDSFFNQQNFRRSDTSVGGNGKLNFGKENRFSNPSPLPPYSSMSNLSIMGGFEEKECDDTVPIKFAGIGKQKAPKSSFSGSLLNLSFLPFTKSSGNNDKSRDNRSDTDTIRPKRLSLGLGFQSSGNYSFPFVHNKGVPKSPPNLPQPAQHQGQDASKQFIRRRSSSFNGECDIQMMTPTPIRVSHNISANATLNRPHNFNKKPKMVTQLSLPSPSPPLSPTYDDLPPPPEFPLSPTDNDCTNLPESPSYFELPPPPPMGIIVPRKHSVPSQFADPLPIQPPLLTNQPVIMRRKLSTTVPSTSSRPPSGDLLPSLFPPPLPTSLPPTLNKIGNNKVRNLPPQFKGKLVRVNAPTLPPLSVPFVRPKSQSPGTPSTWPLEPGAPELFYVNHSESCQKENQPEHESQGNDAQKPTQITIEFIRNECNTNSSNKCIDSSHIGPLSKLLQCKLSPKQWPVMMAKLFLNLSSNTPTSEPPISQAYNELIRSTLDLLLKLEGGTVTLEDFVAAFEQTQIELNQDSDASGDSVITKL